MELYLEKTGIQYINNKEHIAVVLFEKSNEKGSGIRYTQSGKPYNYFWANPKEENRIHPIPEDILFSFKHGSCEFVIEKDKISANITNEQLIRLSSFRFINSEEINIYKKLENIINIEQIKENWSFIKNNGFTDIIMGLCLKEIGVTCPAPFNGEIGIHYLMIRNIFLSNINKIEKSFNIKGV